MGANNHYKAKDFIDVIPGTGGIISTIAKRVGCSWHTAKKYIDTYPTIKVVYDAECEAVLDAAESVILGDIQDKDVQTAKWYLTMKGGDRGYAPKTKQEVTGKDGGPIAIFDVEEWKDKRASRLNQIDQLPVPNEGTGDETQNA
jgi:hypothetical protein